MPLVRSRAMILAPAGLFLRPGTSWDEVKSLPLEELIASRLEQRPYAVRHPRPADLPALLEMEEQCWAPGLRTPADELRRRIEELPTRQWLLEMDGRPAAILYSQRLEDRERLRGATAANVASRHTPDGPIAQLLAINVRQDVQDLGLGDQLLEFVLQLCEGDSDIEHVLAVSLCRDRDPAVPIEEYIRQRGPSGQLRDPILRFHEAHGANITGLVPGYRPADLANEGNGVLVEYELGQRRVASVSDEASGSGAATKTLDEARALVLQCIADVRPDLADLPTDRPLLEHGLDSLDLTQLRERLSRAFGLELSSTFFFHHATIDAISAFVIGDESEEAEPPAGTRPHAAPAATALASETDADAIAIIGMACRLPGGVQSPEDLWQLLEEGRDAIGPVPPDRWERERYPLEGPGSISTWQGGFLNGVDLFDAPFFHIGAREADALDPQQRLLLEVAWETLERAGISPQSLAGSRTGVFVGISSHDYELLQVKRNAAREVYDSLYATGGAPAIAAGRLAYVLGCSGPTLSVDTACSSSLVAVHLACRSLLSGESELALAGGVNLLLSPELSISFSAAGMLAPDGRCKTFDAGANGYVRSEGCALIALKRLSHARRDGDQVLAVIRGTAINQDGFSNGLTAPHGAAQEEVIRDALARAGVAPRDVSYVETHGTGTHLGDPVEVGALASVYGAGRDDEVLLGAVKANLGHTEAAAGITGLLKVVLALQHRRVPRQLHYREPNPELGLDRLPVRIPAEACDWAPATPGGRRIAGLSSFGFSGTNAHAILEEAPPEAAAEVAPELVWRLFTLTAASETALRELCGRFAEHLTSHPELAVDDVCHTVNTGRARLSVRMAALVQSTAELAETLRRFASGQLVGAPAEAPADLRDLLERFLAGEAVGDLDTPGLRRPRKVVLPTYPFERRRHWLGETDGAGTDARAPSEPATEPEADLCYRVEWSEAARSDGTHPLPSPTELAERIPVEVAHAEVDGAVLLPALESLSARYVREAFEALGWSGKGAPPEAADLGVCEEQHRFHGRLAGILVEEDGRGDGRAHEQLDELRARYPAAAVELGIFGRCAGELAGVLRGSVDPLQLLFPQADVTEATRLYERSPTFAPANRLLARAIHTVVDGLPRGQGARILEIGAGTGGTTAALLAAVEQHLPEGRVAEYAFTDVSPLFVNRARDRFGHLPFMEFAPLDVERDPLATGQSAGGYDLVVAANVLHATRDLRATLRHARSLLAPGGLLVLVEGTRQQRWVDLIFGMLDGWWRFEDHDLRPSAPLLSPEAWREAFAASGFADVAVLEPGADDPRLFPQAVLVAQRPVEEPAVTAVDSGRRWLVVGDRGGTGAELAQALEARGQSAVLVQGAQGDGARQSPPELVELLGAAPFDGCIHLTSLDAPVTSALTRESLEQSIEASCASALELVQALVARELDEPPCVWLVTRGAVDTGLRPDEGVPGLAQSPLPGLGRVLGREHPEFRCTHLDLDPGAADGDVASLVDEILGERPGGASVSYRGGRRLEAQLVRTPLETPAEPPPVHAEGAYLITGGLGGLGLEVARWLVSHGARHLVLAGRSGAPAPNSAAAQVVAELRKSGATVETPALDVARTADVEGLVAQITRGEHPLRGVVHAAGVYEDRLLADHEWELFRKVLAAKVDGAWNLHQATEDLPLDFFVLFSSAMSFLGSPGLANYVAANTFLDTLAHHRRARGLPAQSIAWGPWRGVGMAQAVGSRREEQWAAEGLRPIDREAALRVFGRLLAGADPTVAVMDVNWDTYVQRVPGAAGSSFLRGLATAAIPAAAAAPEASSTQGGSAELRALPEAARSARLTALLRAEVARCLSLPAGELDEDEGLFRLGLDSLSAMELRNRLQQELDLTLPPTLTFKFPTIRELAAHLTARLGETGPAGAAVSVDKVVAVPAAGAHEPIAIVGMGCRFPGGASSPDEFWELLEGRVDAIGPLPEGRYDAADYFDPRPGTPGKTYVTDGGYLEGIDRFDAAFFGISPREAVCLDPQHRLFLEVSWEALENAGVPPSTLRGTRTGVFTGIGQDDYAQHRLRGDGLEGIEPYDGTGNLFCFAPGRLAYFLGLRGPNMAIDTACSSSLVALHEACQNLRAGSCDLALAGGVHLAIAPEVTLFLSQARVLAPDGRCKAFSASADGFGRGEGCGVLVLKRLSQARADGDRIHAVIRGVAVNHDGHSSGLTVPSEVAQTELIRQALADAELAPQSVDYVEAHGTGTSLGDPIEVAALVDALGEGRGATEPLLVGSVKTNLGHLEAAAGVAGVMKAVLALERGEIPGQLHFDRPNPHVDWEHVPIEVVDRARPWPTRGGPRVAGVSSFGFSGTNAHVLLEAPPAPAPVDGARGDHVFVLSARTEESLRRLVEATREHLQRRPRLAIADVCGSASRRDAFRFRLALVVSGVEQLVAALGDVLASWRWDGVSLAQVDEASAPRDAPTPRDASTSLDAASAAASFLAGEPLDRDALYPRGSFHLVDLPTYAFDRERFWVERAVRSSARGSAPGRVVHELLGRRLDAATLGADTTVFEARLQPSAPAYLDDHRVFGSVVVPAAAFVEAAIAATRIALGVDEVVLENVEIQRALVLDDENPCRVQTTVRRTDGGADRFEIHSAAGASGADPAGEADPARWTLHAAGSLRAADASDRRETVEGAAVRARCTRAHDVAELYRHYSQIGVDFGEAFQTVREMSSGADETFSRVELAESLRADAADCALHPVLLDGCFQSAAAALQGDASGRTYLPVGIERVVFRRSPGHAVPCLGRARGSAEHAAGGASSHVLDLELLGAGGEAVAHVQGLTLRAAEPASLLRPRNSVRDSVRTRGSAAAARLHELVWRPESAAPASTARRRWVLFESSPSPWSTDLAQSLETRGDSATTIHNLDQLESILATAGDPVQVIDLRALAATGGAERQAQAMLEEVAATCGRVRALVAAGVGENAPRLQNLVIVTRGAHVLPGDSHQPPLAQAALWGLAAVIPHELPGVAGACIDLDPQGDGGEVERLATELASDARWQGVAFRRGERLELRLAEHSTPAGSGHFVRDDGTYLITGGYGALGSAIARWLVAGGARHLALCGREPGATADQLSRELEAAGAEVRIGRVDVADAAQVDAFVAELKQTLPPLAGVVHAAGVVADGTLAQLDEDKLRQVLAPKVAGTLALHRATLDQPLDFFVCFSSAAGVIGSAGQADYAAASRCMDAIVAARRAAGLPGLAVGWGPWAGGGMAAEAPEAVRARWAQRGFGTLSPSDGLAALGRLLRTTDAPASITSLPIDWARYLPATYGASVPPLFDELNEPFAGSTAAATAAPLTELTAGEARKRLAELVRESVTATLALRSTAAIGDRTSLFELGLDSLMATELRNRLQSALGGEIASTVVFDHPTVERLVDHLAERFAPAPEEVMGREVMGRGARGSEARDTRGREVAPAERPAVDGEGEGEDTEPRLEAAIAEELAALETLLES